MVRVIREKHKSDELPPPPKPTWCPPDETNNKDLEAYKEGYKAGFADGYKEGFADKK